VSEDLDAYYTLCIQAQVPVAPITALRFLGAVSVHPDAMKQTHLIQPTTHDLPFGIIISISEADTDERNAPLFEGMISALVNSIVIL
jgi:hypothetical protein